MYVYGIWVSNDKTGYSELVYIGSTTQQLADRFQQHKERLENPNYKRQPKLYNALRWYKINGFQIRLEQMIDVNELKYHPDKMWTKRDLQMLEFALISYFKPKLNVAGVDTYFVF